MLSRPALGATQPPIQWVLGALCPRVKRPGREANHSPPTNAEDKKMWVYTSTPPYVFMAWWFTTSSDMNVLQTELSMTYRKYKEWAHMPLEAHLISQFIITLPSGLPSLTRKTGNYTSIQFRLFGNVPFLCWNYTGASPMFQFAVRPSVVFRKFCLLEF
jgi:hypothetical protein